MLHGTVHLAFEPLEQRPDGFLVEGGQFAERVRGRELDSRILVTEGLNQACRSFGFGE